MTEKPTLAWPLPILAFVQLMVGTAVLLSPLSLPVSAWGAGDAALASAISLAGLTMMALAVRNCVRLWAVPPSEASWALVATAALMGLLSALVALGPTVVGVFSWESRVSATFAVYLLVVLVREVCRRLARHKTSCRSSKRSCISHSGSVITG